MEVTIVTNVEELTSVAAQKLVHLAKEAIDRSDRFTVALAGGSTPKGLYALLASEKYRPQIQWDKVHLFWGDERHVPPEHQDSNYRMVKETLLSQIPIPPEHIHRIRGEFSNASEAADHYERELQGHFHLQAGEKPRFDMVLLGMGPDGHTASLFPGTTAVSETTRLVTAPWVEKFGTYRITLTAPVLNEAANVVFLVCGKDKAETLRLVLESENQIDNYPAQLIRPVQGHLLWLVDQAAASALTKHH